MRHCVAVAAIALLLAGCSSTSQDDGAARPGPTTPTSDASGRSDAGDHVSLELGETAELSAKADGTEPATWTIEKIEVDPPCDAQDGPRESGHVLLLHVRADSGPDKDAAELIPGALEATSFTEPGENGESSQASPWLCGSPAPGNQALTGTVGLVVPEANGTLIQTDPVTESEGWRWSYPAN